MKLQDCIKKAGKTLIKEDRDAVRKAMKRRLGSTSYPTEEAAALGAISEVLYDVSEERRKLVEKVEGMGAEVPESVSEKEERKKKENEEALAEHARIVKELKDAAAAEEAEREKEIPINLKNARASKDPIPLNNMHMSLAAKKKIVLEFSSKKKAMNYAKAYGFQKAEAFEITSKDRKRGMPSHAPANEISKVQSRAKDIITTYSIRYKTNKKNKRWTSVKYMHGFITLHHRDQIWAEWQEGVKDVDGRGRLVLSLFDRTGVWSKPYRDAGYHVEQVDIDHPLWAQDVMEISGEQLVDYGWEDVHAVIAQPPCTHFSTARQWEWPVKDKDGRTHQGIELLNHTEDIIAWLKPDWWVLENPGTSRINKPDKFADNVDTTVVGKLGEPSLKFNPNKYGDDYTKNTGLWGGFNAELPEANVFPAQGSRIWKLTGYTKKSKQQRSVTPYGFSLAFFQANSALSEQSVDMMNWEENWDYLDEIIDEMGNWNHVREMVHRMAKIKRWTPEFLQGLNITKEKFEAAWDARDVEKYKDVEDSDGATIDAYIDAFQLIAETSKENMVPNDMFGDERSMLEYALGAMPDADMNTRNQLAATYKMLSKKRNAYKNEFGETEFYTDQILKDLDDIQDLEVPEGEAAKNLQDYVDSVRGQLTPMIEGEVVKPALPKPKKKVGKYGKKTPFEVGEKKGEFATIVEDMGKVVFRKKLQPAMLIKYDDESISGKKRYYVGFEKAMATGNHETREGAIAEFEKLYPPTDNPLPTITTEQVEAVGGTVSWNMIQFTSKAKALKGIKDLGLEHVKGIDVISANPTTWSLTQDETKGMFYSTTDTPAELKLKEEESNQQKIANARRKKDEQREGGEEVPVEAGAGDLFAGEQSPDMFPGTTMTGEQETPEGYEKAVYELSEADKEKIIIHNNKQLDDFVTNFGQEEADKKVRGIVAGILGGPGFNTANKTSESAVKAQFRFEVVKAWRDGNPMEVTKKGKAETQETIKAQKILDLLGSQSDVWQLSGPRNVNRRVELYKLLHGVDKIAKAKAGVVALEKKLHEIYKPEGNSPAARQSDLQIKLEDAAKGITKEKQESIDKSVDENPEVIPADEQVILRIDDEVSVGGDLGVVVGISGDMVQFRSHRNTNPKAYTNVPYEFVKFIKTPGTGTASHSRVLNELEEEGFIDMDQNRAMKMLGERLYTYDLYEVAVKELIQNSFDAGKGAINAGLTDEVTIDVETNSNDRTITVTDNALGMDIGVVRKAFFTIAGSAKPNLPVNQRSGGLGLAKLGTFLNAEHLYMRTTQKGSNKAIFVNVNQEQVETNKFPIQYEEADVNEHGTIVRMTIPREKINLEGVSNWYSFPRDQESISFFGNPLIHDGVTITYKSQDTERVTLPLGKHSDFTGIPHNNVATFPDWGKADIYYGEKRKENARTYVLSAGVYQFAYQPSMRKREQIPYDIIINIHSDKKADEDNYPFANNRQGFNPQVNPDIKLLNRYLAKVALGEEAKNLQQDMTNIVSMPIIEQEKADKAIKARQARRSFNKKTEEKLTPEQEAELAAFRKAERKSREAERELRFENDKITDKEGNTVVESEAEEKRKKIEEKVEKEGKMETEKDAPELGKFMDTMLQDPTMPLFHNNTDVNVIEIGREHGNPEQFFAELGTLFMEMKDIVSKSGLFKMEGLKASELFFAGISIDKGYGGIHIKVPYKAVFLNPLYAQFNDQTLYGNRGRLMNTMIHELAHQGDMDHGSSHNSVMIRIETYLEDQGMYDYFRDSVLKTLMRHQPVYSAMREAYDKSSIKNTGKSFKDYKENSNSESFGRNKSDTGKSGRPIQPGGREDISLSVSPNEGARYKSENTRRILQQSRDSASGLNQAQQIQVEKHGTGIQLSEGIYPWSIKTSGEGDLYITRVGTNVGTVHKTRQGPNDLVMTVDQSQLLPDYTYYLLQYLKPQLQRRATGSVQQAIRKGDIDKVLYEHFTSPPRSMASVRSAGLSVPEAKKAVRKALGHKLTQRIEFYETLSDLPENVARNGRQLLTEAGMVEGFVIGRKAYLITKNLRNKERAAWVAWHEMWHRGAKIRFGAAYTHVLRKARENNVVHRLSNAIQNQRTAKLNDLQATDEALAELSSAIRTRKFGRLERQYKVKLPTGMKSGWRAAVRKWLDAIKRVMKITSDSPMTDAQVANLIRGTDLNAGGRVDRVAYSERGRVDPFFSSLTSLVMNPNGMPKTGTAQDWKNWFKGKPNKPKYKASKVEYDWIGMDEFLDNLSNYDQGVITRTEIQQFVQDHPMIIKEVILGEEDFEYGGRGSDDPTMYDYNEPGEGGDYDKRFYMVDNFRPLPSDSGIYQQAVSYLRRVMNFENKLEVLENIVTPETNTSAHERGAYELARETLLYAKRNEIADLSLINVLENLNVNDYYADTPAGRYRLTRNGRGQDWMILAPEVNIEDETQEFEEPDGTQATYSGSIEGLIAWASETIGPIENPEKTETRFESDEYNEQGGENYRELLFYYPDSRDARNHYGEQGMFLHVRFDERPIVGGGKMLFIQEIQADIQQRIRRERLEEEASDPDMYQQDTSIVSEADRKAIIDEIAKQFPIDAPYYRINDYTMLAMKRMIRWAAENEFDSIGWTPGKMQNNRWGYERTYYDVTLRENASFSTDEDLRIVATSTSGRGATLYKVFDEQEFKKVFPDIPIADVTGPNQHMLNEWTYRSDNASGMEGAYDDIAVNETNKFIKKFGSKVRFNESFPQPELARGGDYTTDTLVNGIHIFDVTDAMRDTAIDEGFALSEAPPDWEFNREAVEERYRAAGKASRPESWPQRFKDRYNDIKIGFQRHYIHLPDTVEFSNAIQQLRKLEAAPDVTRDQTVRLIKLITQNMTSADLDLFTRKIVLDDLKYEITQDHDLPMDLTPEEVHETLARIDTILADRPDLQEAIEARRVMVRSIGEQMVKAGVLTEDQLNNPYYFRHQVLEYAFGHERYAGKNKLRRPKWARRKGSIKDINVNYLEVEFEYLSKSLGDIAIADTIQWFKDSDHNVHSEVVEAGRQANESRFAALLAYDLDVNGYDVLNKDGEVIRRTSPLAEESKTYRRRIAMGLKEIRDGLDQATYDIPSKYEEVAYEIYNEVDSQNPLFYEFLGWLADKGKEGSMGAKMVFSAINQRKAWKKSLLGDKYVNTQNIDELISNGFAPEGYVAWQPDQGRMLFTAKTLSENVIDSMLIKLSDEGAGLTGVDAKYMLDSIRTMLAVGGKKYQMIIPAELALTFEGITDQHVAGLTDNMIAEALTMWKRWQLISPRRIAKYNINNMSGDLDAVIAVGPKILKKLGPAMKELQQVMYQGANPSNRYTAAIRRDVFGSGLTLQEIRKIDEMGEFRNLLEGDNLTPAQMAALPKDKILKVWRGMQKFTWFRENWLRYAAYLHYIELLESGKELTSIDYGASRPEIVDSIIDVKDKAALLARQAVGDYGNISHFGGHIRRNVFPFWSWVEVNMKRYWRLFDNAMHHNIWAGVTSGSLVGATLGIKGGAWLTMRMLTVYTAVQLWNNLRHGDDEDDLTLQERLRLHVNLGRSEDGQVRTLRFQGALSDFLDWTGFVETVAAIGEVEKGQAKAPDVVAAFIKAPINKFVGGFTPVIKVPFESAIGVQLWPDVFHPRRIRDKGRYAAGLFALENEYDAVMDRPSKGYKESLWKMLISKRDPGQLAYSRMTSQAYDYMEKMTGKKGFSTLSTPKSKAMYDYRLAKRYGDADAAAKALQKVIDLSDNKRDALRSLKSYRGKSSPLSMMSRTERSAFKKTLTDHEIMLLGKAEKWHKETFK